MIATTLAVLEQQKADLLARVAGWPSARLAYRPTPLAWSVVEVVDHLGRGEAGILAAAKAGLAEPHPIAARDRVRTWLLDILFRSPARVRVPRSVPQVLPAAPVPSAKASLALAVVEARWSATPGATWRRSSPRCPRRATRRRVPPSGRRVDGRVRVAARRRAFDGSSR
ncbi:hypothetical protein BH11GEM2_BH11GEM2_13700 [soil metagenome]